MDFFRRNLRWEHFHLLKGDDCNDQFIRLMRKVNKTFVNSLTETDFPLNWTQKKEKRVRKQQLVIYVAENQVNLMAKFGFCSGMIDNPNYKRK